MIVDSAVYRDGRRLSLDVAKDDYAALRKAVSGAGDFVWVGLLEPDEREMADVMDAFGLHPLAVEDSLHAHQRPKLEAYDAMIFIVLKTLWYVEDQDAVETGQVTIFVGRDFLVTVRQGQGSELHSARIGLEHQTAVLGHGPSAAVYAVCDRIVDTYEAVVAALQTDVDEVEASVFSDSRTADALRIYTLKRELAEARRAVLPLLDPMQRFAGGEVPHLVEGSRPFFRDVHDHLARIALLLDGLDTLLAAAFQAYLAQVTVRQNDDMRKISAWAGIAAASTLVAGIYGMNFRYMPELDWRVGYPMALLLMVGIAFLLWRAFKRSGWL